MGAWLAPEPFRPGCNYGRNPISFPPMQFSWLASSALYGGAPLATGAANRVGDDPSAARVTPRLFSSSPSARVTRGVLIGRRREERA